MINRRSSAYYALPEEMSGPKQKDAKLNISFGMVVPPEFEKKADKFMKEQMDEVAKEFKKFMNKQCRKYLENDDF